MLTVDTDGAVASEQRMRFRRSKSSSSLSQMTDSRETLGEVVKINSSSWGNKGLLLSKFGQSSQLHLLHCLF